MFLERWIFGELYLFILVISLPSLPALSTTFPALPALPSLITLISLPASVYTAKQRSLKPRTTTTPMQLDPLPTDGVDYHQSSDEPSSSFPSTTEHTNPYTAWLYSKELIAIIGIKFKLWNIIFLNTK